MKAIFFFLLFSMGVTIMVAWLKTKGIELTSVDRLLDRLTKVLFLFMLIAFAVRLTQWWVGYYS